MVLNALVGSAGLAPTLATLQSGKTLALANKESLVVGGELVTDLIKGEPERLLPVDSEHAALAMAMRGERTRGHQARRAHRVRADRSEAGRAASSARASVKEALQHPVWSMGPKITIDSATLDEQGARGDRGALPVRPGVLLDPRADPSRGRRARHGGVPRRQPACRDGDSPTCGCRSSSPWPGPSACPPGWSRCRSPSARSRSSRSTARRSPRSTSPTASADWGSRSRR